MLAYDAARGAVDLYVSGNTRAAIILQRQLYEYTVRARYYVREPELGIKAFKARKARHYGKMRNLSIRDELRQAIDELHNEWKDAHPEVTDDYGQRGFNKMAATVDSVTGYAYHYEIPSIWVHATLVGFDVFESIDENRLRVSSKSTSLNPKIGLGSVIVILLRFVRVLHVMGFASNPAQYTEESIQITKLLAEEMGVRVGEWSDPQSGDG